MCDIIVTCSDHMFLHLVVVTHLLQLVNVFLLELEQDKPYIDCLKSKRNISEQETQNLLCEKCNVSSFQQNNKLMKHKGHWVSCSEDKGKERMSGTSAGHGGTCIAVVHLLLEIGPVCS